MNKVILMGRLTRDPEVRYSQGANATAVARYSLAVDRRFKRDGEPTADFINCVSFGRTAEFAEKYFRQGLKVVVTGRIQTGSYTNKDGVKVYTTDVVDFVIFFTTEYTNFFSSASASSLHWRICFVTFIVSHFIYLLISSHYPVMYIYVNKSFFN